MPRPLPAVHPLCQADLEVCMEALKVRNLCLPGCTPAEVVARVDTVDRANALRVQGSKRAAGLVVRGWSCTTAPSASSSRPPVDAARVYTR